MSEQLSMWEEQRRSFVGGNCGMGNARVTRAVVDGAAAELRREKGAARRTDPSTSMVAAKASVGCVKAMIVMALTQHPTGLTIAELASATGRKEVSISPRMKGLVAARLVRDSGVRRKNEGGNMAIVWEAV